MTWTYVDDHGLSHKVGLFHGDSTGHLIIYCNSKIMFIDFHVMQSKKYSFFINDELFDVHVEKNDENFAYGFEIDKKSKTPRNAGRKQMEKKQLLQLILFVIGMLIFIALIVFLVMRYMT